MKENYVSPEGLEKAQAELKELIAVKRPEVIERIAAARELGDLSENAEYHEAREDQSFIEGRIQELENLIKNAIIVTGNERTNSIVSIGSTVHAACDNGSKISYTVVGPSEADPMNGKISHESPLGRAFMGKMIGTEFELKVPAGTLKCKITKIA
ncbi:MAG: transcription elongation factor GreA [bacterium]